jgi:hypothetical protein
VSLFAGNSTQSRSSAGFAENPLRVLRVSLFAGKFLDYLSYKHYNFFVYDVETTEEFDAWLGGGLFEARIHYGPGYRLYFVNKETQIIVLLCGGDKSTQRQDIKSAKEMAKEL